ncbi:MAG: undecaprenyl-phosphate glucose phosphotransferase [Bacteroidaceae bacterium]|nr:undecaprenyl-phosphate glucose phosphotransferase [Bacteroidaceae bacterium]
MKQYNSKTSKLMVCSVILGDLILMNILFVVMYHFWPYSKLGPIFSGGYWEMAAFNTLCYIASTYYNGVVLHLRKVRNMHIIGKVTENCAKFIVISVAFIALAGYDGISTRFLFLFHLINYLMLIVWRIFCHFLVCKFRSSGRNVSYCIYLGSGSNIQELYQEQSYKSTGYRVLGYFSHTINEELPQALPYLGKPEDVFKYLENHNVDNIYCSLPSNQSELILQVIHWTEKNFAHFYHVPHVRNYLHRRMWFDTVGDVPVLSLHREPLNEIDNRIIKRAFDLIMSGIFLCTVFPFFYIIVGTIIKITSPGPIFFKQKRNGINGKEFWCYKFRSMKVNKDADSVQATKNDPRKTKFGDFMRKTNIDELPQLINVFIGDMSLVGPRPHMLKHTEEYSKLIDNYMVRHFVKPGITGWAQITGYRGETKELHQMEGRVAADIWYMEHWSFLLDLHIIYKTFANVIQGEKNAY